MIKGYSQAHVPGVPEGHQSSLSGLQRVGKRWMILSLILFIVISFPIMAPFTVSPYALSPIGMTLVLIPLVLALWQVFKRVALWINRENLASGAMATLVFLSSPIPQPASAPSPFWNMMYENMTLMWSPAAWQAAFDFNTDMGVPGYAPLIYRPLVAEYPITLVAIPGAIPGLYEPFAAVSGLQAVPFSDSFAIWNTLSPHQTLQVQNTVLLTNDMAAPQLDPQMMVSMLSVNCTDCRHAFQLNINPEYMEKLVWNTGVFIVGQTPLGRGFTAGDAITGAVLSGHLIARDMQAASATASGWATGKLIDFFDVDDSETWIGGLASHLAGNMVEKVIDPISMGSTWNFQVFDASLGVSTDDFDAYAWQSQSISTYSGSFLGTDWKVETQGELHFAHVSSVNLDLTTVELPDLFYENMNILNQSLVTIPTITFSPTRTELPDVLPYSPSRIVPNNFAETIPDIVPYSPPQTTIEMPNYGSLDTQPFNPPITSWP